MVDDDSNYGTTTYYASILDASAWGDAEGRCCYITRILFFLLLCVVVDLRAVLLFLHHQPRRRQGGHSRPFCKKIALGEITSRVHSPKKPVATPAFDTQ